MTTFEKAARLLNQWVYQYQFKSSDLQSRRLVQMIATLVSRESQDAYERGVEDGKAASSPFSW